MQNVKIDRQQQAIRSREEGLLLERWAASDSARTMEDEDCDESLDRFDSVSVAAYSLK